MAPGTSLVRRCLVAATMLVIGGGLAACNDEAPTTEVATDTTEPSEPDVDQPSALELLDGRGSHGTFSVSVPGGAHGQVRLTYTGRYTTTRSGRTYTIADLDLPLVQAEVARLVAMGDRFDSLDPMFVDDVLSTETIVTDHLQVGLGDLLLMSGIFGSAGALAAYPSLAFTAVRSGELDACRDSLDHLRGAVRRRLLDEVDALGGDWEPDPALLGGDELDAVTTECDGLEEIDPSRIDLTADEQTLRVAADGVTVLEIEVHPEDGEAVTVGVDTPTAPLLDRFGLFFLAIDRCGELPWLYSNFAAADTYHSPDDGSYIGPTPFDEVPVCEDEVPER